MRHEYEQLELDTRHALLRAITTVTNDAVRTAGEMAVENMKQTGTVSLVHNRHEAYGIAAEQLSKINSAVKSIKDDTSKLLGTLSEPNKSAVEPTSDIYNSTLAAAVVLVIAAAEMKRTMDDLYTAEIEEPEPTPMERLVAGDFQEAESLTDTDADTGDENETED